MTTHVTSLALSAIAAVLLLAGCSDSKARQDGQAIRDQVDVSRRLCERALSLVANPSLSLATPTAATSQGEAGYDLAPANSVSPEAFSAARKAADSLSAVLQQTPDAPKADLVLGQQALGEAYMTLGVCQDQQVQNDWRDVGRTLANVNLQLTSLERLQAAVAFLGKLTAMNDDDLAKLSKDIEAEKAKVDEELAALEKKATPFDADLTKERSDHEAALTKAGKLTIDAQATTGPAARDLHKQAAVAQAEADRLAISIMEKEPTSDQYRQQQAILKEKGAKLALNQTLAADALNARKETAKTTTAKKDEMTKSAEEARQAVAALAAKLAQEAAPMLKDEDTAAQTLKTGSEKLTSVLRLGTGVPLYTQVGIAYMTYGDFRMAQLHRQQRLAGMIDRLEAALKDAVPAALTALRTSMSKADTLTTSARDAYSLAVTNFQIGTNAASKDDRFMVQRSLMTALLKQAQLESPSASPALISAADKALTASIAGREDTVFAAEARADFERLKEPGPTSKPD